MKKLLSVVLVLALSCIMFSAFAEGETIEVCVNFSGSHLEVFQAIVADFEAATGIKVELTVPGDDYEATMKTRMGSNELPDVWVTHGWSLIRYSEYLRPLNDQSWYDDLDSSALGVIADDEGQIYVLMISELVNATLVNKTVCEAAGVDYTAIYTYDDFYAACEKIKAAGYTPIGTTANAGVVANSAGTWVTYEGATYEDGDAQLDGTFDWDHFKTSELADMQKWLEAGFYYEDYATINDTDMKERWAADQAAFVLGNDPGFLYQCLTLNPDGDYAFIPNFCTSTDEKRFIGIGEGDAFGIWKDTENLEAAEKFLEFLATPEVASKLNADSGNISCLTTVPDTSYGATLFAECQANYADDIFYDNLWDRKFMPSGMWGIFGTACGMLATDYSDDGLTEVTEYLAENYTDLWEQQHE